MKSISEALGHAGYDHYELSVMRVERTFIAHESNNKEDAIEAYRTWIQQENVNKVILRENGEILKCRVI